MNMERIGAFSPESPRRSRSVEDLSVGDAVIHNEEVRKITIHRKGASNDFTIGFDNGVTVMLEGDDMLEIPS